MPEHRMTAVADTLRRGVACVALVAASQASALCLDPRTFASGYQVPLIEEVRSAAVIVTGKVVGGQELREDADDPQGVTAHLWTVRPIRPLKGHVPRLLMLRVENTSGRYPIQAGEEHLLFLARDGKHFLVDGCGNSSALPEAAAVLTQLEAMLVRGATAR